ncbi:hypothetical protein ACP70R_009671 [Stipagrostis hirtigluma subsp. patula]
MEDSSLFIPWAMTTLQHEHPAAAPADDYCGEPAFPSLQALREAALAAEMIDELINAANSWSPGDATDGGSVGDISAPKAIDQDNLSPSPNTVKPTSRRNSGATKVPTMSWNFSAVSAQPGSDGTAETAAAARDLPEQVHASPPTRRAAGSKSAGPKSMPSSYTQDHIIAERKRREKINQRFIELSAVIPGLKKMDKATILSDATRYVKGLQEKLKAVEDGSSKRCVDSVVLAKKPRIAARSGGGGSPSRDSSGTPPARKPLPEIEATFSEKTVMVRIHCEEGKGVAALLLAQVEALHLCIVHANVMPFPACTLMITITAKVEEGFAVRTEDIVGRLNSALLHQPSNCSCTEETKN